MPMMFAKWCKHLTCAALLSLVSVSAWAQPYTGPNDGDTILVEKEVSQKIPYHRLAKSLVKKFLKFNTDNVLSFGNGRKDTVIRHFSDLADRTKYRVNMDRDEVELKFTLHL